MFNRLFSVLSRLVLGAISLVIIVGVPTLIIAVMQILLQTFNLRVSTIVFSFLGLFAVYILGDVTFAAIKDFLKHRRVQKAFRKGMVSNDR